jgi:ADP-ribose pyrophosphatase YjhB (NUDIX family)
MTDIIFQKEGWAFGLRAQGTLVCNGKALLQKPRGTNEYAFPGGHMAFGETFAETLKREWLDEVENITVYPMNAADLLSRLDGGVEHLIYKE